MPLTAMGRHMVAAIARHGSHEHFLASAGSVYEQQVQLVYQTGSVPEEEAAAMRQLQPGPEQRFFYETGGATINYHYHHNL